MAVPAPTPPGGPDRQPPAPPVAHPRWRIAALVIAAAAIAVIAFVLVAARTPADGADTQAVSVHADSIRTVVVQDVPGQLTITGVPGSQVTMTGQLHWTGAGRGVGAAPASRPSAPAGVPLRGRQPVYREPPAHRAAPHRHRAVPARRPRGAGRPGRGAADYRAQRRRPGGRPAVTGSCRVGHLGAPERHPPQPRPAGSRSPCGPRRPHCGCPPRSATGSASR